MARGTSGTLGGDAVRLTLSKTITLCITMVTTMFLSRFRTVEEYGTYSQLLLATNLCVTLIMLGLPNSINFFLARAETGEEKQHFLSVYYTLSTLLSMIIGLVLVLSVPLMKVYFHNKAIDGFAYFLALFPWASIISSSIENVLVVYRKTQFLIIYRVLNSVALLAAVLVVQWLGYGFAIYMYVFIAVNSLFAVAVYLIASRISGGLRPMIDRRLTRAIFTFSIPIGLSAVVGTLNTELDKLLIGYMMDTESLAIYTNAAKELPLTIVAASVTAVLLPHLTLMIKHNKAKDAVKLWGHATELAYIIMALIVAGLFTYAEDAMTILYSAKYLPGVTVFRIYTLNLLMRCTYFGIILNAFGHTRKILLCSVFSLGLNVILNPVLYFAMGMIGPAIATFICILFIMLFQLRMTSDLVDVRVAKIFPWKRIFYLTLINAGFAVVFGTIKAVLPIDRYIGSIAEALVLGAVWTVIYLSVMKGRLRISWNELNKGDETA